MEFPISLPGFEGQNLTVKPAGFWRAQLLQNGLPLKRQKGHFSVQNNAGETVPIRFKTEFLDPIPKVIIGDDVIHLVPSLRWYEYLWAGFPILLLFIGGAVGGLLGAAAAYTNAKIFRTQRSAPAKYALTGLVSIGAAIAWLAVGVILVALIGNHR
jgi:hypothetical protein